MDLEEDDAPDESSETGSDELLAEDDLRLPESANILVRLHAVRAWLARRRHEATIQVGEAALDLQQAVLQEPEEISPLRPRRRAQQLLDERRQQAQLALADAQERLSAYEEAQAVLEDCVAHTSGERVLVEYYLALEELVQNAATHADQPPHAPAWFNAMADVQHRIEHVGIPVEEE